MATEVYPNAPLQLVAFEVGFQSESALSDAALLDALASALPTGCEIHLAPRGLLRDSNDGSGLEAPMFRLVGRGRTLAVTLWRRVITVEETDYRHFDDYCRTLAPILDALCSGQEARPIHRIGLRYVDEVHAPHPVESLEDWRPYVHEALVWPTDLVDTVPETMSAAFSVPLGESNSLHVRTAILPGPALQSDNAGLRLRLRPDTPSFVLDCDASHSPMPAPRVYVTTEILEILGHLRGATNAMFERVFTDRARDVFREESR